MPSVKKPTSDPDRMVFIEAANNAAIKDFGVQSKYLMDKTYTRLTAFYPIYKNAIGSVNHAGSSYSKELKEKNQQQDRLAMFCRDAWDAVYRQARRLGYPAQIFPLYGMSLNGNIPEVSSPGSWAVWAETILKGDMEAAKLGYRVCQAPTAAELGEELGSARKESTESDDADKAYLEAQSKAAALRSEADKIIDQVIAELDLFLRELNPTSSRRIMRRYGVKFDYINGEPQDSPDDEIPKAQEQAVTEKTVTA